MGDDAKKASKVLQFSPFQSLVDVGFWHRFSSLKLNQLGLDDSPIPITGMLYLRLYFDQNSAFFPYAF